MAWSDGLVNLPPLFVDAMFTTLRLSIHQGGKGELNDMGRLKITDQTKEIFETSRPHPKSFHLDVTAHKAFECWIIAAWKV